MNNSFTIFAGRANVALATSVAVEMGARLGACSVERFPDGELSVRLDEPVRGREVLIIQPTSPPVNDHLIELLAFADACRRASASHITAVMPYFGYARADKRHGRREPITASMVAALMQAVGVNHVVTIDLHAPQIEGFFHIPVDSLTAAPVMVEALRPGLPPETVVVSPDAGARADTRLLGVAHPGADPRLRAGARADGPISPGSGARPVQQPVGDGPGSGACTGRGVATSTGQDDDPPIAPPADRPAAEHLVGALPSRCAS